MDSDKKQHETKPQGQSPAQVPATESHEAPHVQAPKAQVENAPKANVEAQKVTATEHKDQKKKQNIEKAQKAVEKVVEQKKQEKKEQEKKQDKKQQNKQEKKTEKKEEASKPAQKKQTMKSVMLSGAKTYKVVDLPIPKPSSGEVLVKIMAAPINPSDLALFGGHYSHQKKFPTVMGFEGSGIVVESGGGLMGWGLVGKKVAFAVEKQGQGSYSQYCLVKSQQCLPLSDDTTFEQGAMCVINPFTALAMLDVVKQRKQKCVVITAAASQLGRMINRIYPKEGVEVINIVRRAEQVEILKAQGAKYILNSTDQNFETELRVLADKMGSRSCLEAVGGEFTGIVARNMPKNSVITVYGCLSQKNITDLSVMDLLANNKVINGFLLPQWLKTKNTMQLLPLFYKVRSTITEGLKSNVAKKFKLQQLGEAVEYYLKNMTEGKVLMEPWSE